MSRNEYVRDNGGHVKVYVDGCCFNQGKSNAAAGCGIFFNFNHIDNLSCPIKKREKVDNTAAEAQAAEKSIEIAAQRSINKLIIVTDSQTLVNFDKNCFKWEKEGWEDKDLYALNQIKKRCSNIDVDFEYVEAHSRNKYNDEAHKLAKKGAILYAQQCAILYAEQFYTMKL